jgi:hypothetical protein
MGKWIACVAIRPNRGLAKHPKNWVWSGIFSIGVEGRIRVRGIRAENWAVRPPDKGNGRPGRF